MNGSATKRWFLGVFLVLKEFGGVNRWVNLANCAAKPYLILTGLQDFRSAADPSGCSLRGAKMKR